MWEVLFWSKVYIYWQFIQTRITIYSDNVTRNRHLPNISRTNGTLIASAFWFELLCISTWVFYFYFLCMFLFSCISECSFFTFLPSQADDYLKLCGPFSSITITQYELCSAPALFSIAFMYLQYAIDHQPTALLSMLSFSRCPFACHCHLNSLY